MELVESATDEGPASLCELVKQEEVARTLALWISLRSESLVELDPVKN